MQKTKTRNKFQMAENVEKKSKGTTAGQGTVGQGRAGGYLLLPNKANKTTKTGAQVSVSSSVSKR